MHLEFYGVGYEKSDGTADGYFFFGRKALVSKTQEELLRPLDSIMRVETEEDRNPYSMSRALFLGKLHEKQATGG